MNQIKIDGLGVKELTDVELVNTDGGSFLNSMATQIATAFADMFKLNALYRALFLSLIDTFFPE